MRDSWTDMLRNDLARLTESISGPARAAERLKPGERREVAVVFLDLSGFTTLSEHLDHEEVHRLANSLMGTLGSVVEAHGGYVDKIEGDRIMALFGARVAGENDCIRAVACGLRMLRVVDEVHSLLSRNGSSLSARVGVSYGSATVAPDAAGHLTAMGDEVNLASRMQEMAPVGSMLVSQRVRRICGDGFEWRDSGELPVRGRTRSVHAWEPVGVRQIQEDRWRRNALAGRTALAGREAEMLLLSSALGSAAEGRPAAVSILGEAGIGKSRLAWELLESIRPGSFTVLRGQALSFAQPPYWFWTGLLRRFLGLEGDPSELGGMREALERMSPTAGTRSGMLDEHMPALADLALSSSGGWLDPEMDEETRNVRRRLAIAFLLELAALQGPPVLLVIDDAHWLDGASAEAIRFACRSPVLSDRLSVLVTSRCDGTDADPLSPVPSAQRSEIRLGPLDDDSSLEIVKGMLGPGGGEPPAGAVEFLLGRARGVPYCLEELLLDILDRGLLRMEGSAWVFSGGEDLPVPSSIAGIVTARYDRLPPGPRRILQVASVLGQTFERDVLERVAGMSSPVGEGEVEALFASSFLESSPDGTLGFRSSLTRQTVYDMLLFQNRMVLHRHAAAGLAELRPNDSERIAGLLAWHHYRAGDVQEAVGWGIRMLKTLYGGYQHREVISWATELRGWIGGMPPSRQTDSLLLQVVRIEGLSNEYLMRQDRLETLYAEARELCTRLGDESGLGRTWLETGLLRSHSARFGEAMTCFETALETARRAGDRRLEGRSVANIALALTFSGDMDRAETRFGEALEIFEELGDLHDIGVTIQNLATLYGQRGERDRAVETLRRALEIHSHGSPYPRGEAVVLTNLGVHRGMDGDPAGALECFERALDLQRQLGNRRGEAIILGNLGCCYLETGRREDGRRAFEEAYSVNSEINNRRSMAIALTNLARLREEDGDLEAAREGYLRALAINESDSFLAGIVACRSYLAALEAGTGSVAQSEDTYRAVVRSVEESGLAEAYVPSVMRLRERLMESGVPGSRLPRPSNWK